MQSLLESSPTESALQDIQGTCHLLFEPTHIKYFVSGLPIEPQKLVHDVTTLEQASNSPTDSNKNELQERQFSKNLESSQNSDELSSNLQISDGVANQETVPVETKPVNAAVNIVPTDENEEQNEEPTDSNALGENSHQLQISGTENNTTNEVEEKQVDSLMNNANESSGTELSQLPKLELSGMQELNSTEDIPQANPTNAKETAKKGSTKSKKKQETTTSLKDNKGPSISRKNSATLLSGQAGSPSPLKRRSSSRSFKFSEDKRSGNTTPVESEATSPGQQKTVSSKADSASSEHHMSQPSLVRRSSSKSLYKPTQSSAAKEKKKQEDNNISGGKSLHTPAKTGKNQTGIHYIFIAVEKVLTPLFIASSAQETSKKPSIGIARFMKPTIAASAKFSEKKTKDSSVPKNSWKL